MNNNICEIIQTAILSDETLTDEQLNHVENCPECKALLSQINDMKEGLSCLCVPGLEEGQITKSVMERIQREKTSIPMPKFKITHHLGTAAAVAIILVAALMIKNPSDIEMTEDNSTENAPAVFVQQQNNHTLSASIESDEPEQEENVMFRFSAATTDGQEENIVGNETYADDKSDDQDNEARAEVMMMKSVPPSPSVEESMNEPMLLSDSYDTEASSGNAGGGGGGSLSYKAYEDHAIDLLSDKNIRAQVFLEGEENFDYNITLANNSIYSVYGIENYFDRETLEKEGYNNKRFLDEFDTLIAPLIQ